MRLATILTLTSYLKCTDNESLFSKSMAINSLIQTNIFEGYINILNVFALHSLLHLCARFSCLVYTTVSLLIVLAFFQMSPSASKSMPVHAQMYTLPYVSDRLGYCALVKIPMSPTARFHADSRSIYNIAMVDVSASMNNIWPNVCKSWNKYVSPKLVGK